MSRRHYDATATDALAKACARIAENLLAQARRKHSQGEPRETEIDISADRLMVIKALEDGANPDIRIRGVDESFPIEVAVRWSLPDVLEALLKAGANVRIQDHCGCTLGAWVLSPSVIRRGSANADRMLEALLRAGIDPNELTYEVLGEEPVTLLVLAAIHLRYRAIELLLDAGARTEIESRTRETRLSRSATGHPLTYLLSRPPHTFMDEGLTWNDLMVDRWLTRAEKIIQYTVPASRQAMIDNAFIAAVIAGNAKAVEFLISHGAKVDGCSPSVKPPIFDAMDSKSTAGLKLMIDLGADINIRGPDGETPLQVIVRNQKTEHFKLMVSAGVDLDAPFTYGTAKKEISLRQYLSRRGKQIKPEFAALAMAALARKKFQDDIGHYRSAADQSGSAP